MSAAKDRRIWIKLAVEMPSTPKIAILSDAAFRAYVEMLCYSRDQLTDGFIHGRIVARRWPDEVVEELCSNAGDESSSLLPVEMGFQIRDYEKHQETREDVERRIENGAKGGRAKAANRSEGASGGSSTTRTVTSSGRRSPGPTESESESEKTKTTLDLVSHETYRASGADSTDVHVDLLSLMKNIELVCDIKVTAEEAVAYARHVLGKARKTVDNPDAYVTSSVRWEETTKWIKGHRK